MGAGALANASGIGQAAGDIKNVTTALGQYQSINQMLAMQIPQTAAAQKALNTQLDAFAPSARSAVLAASLTASQFHGLYDVMTGFAEGVGASIIQQAIQVGEGFLPALGAAAARNMLTLRSALQPFFDWLSGPEGIQIFHDLENEFSSRLPESIQAFTNALELVLRVVDIASQDTGSFIAWLDKLFTRLNSESTETLSLEVSKLVDDFRLWEQFVKLLIDDIYLLFHEDVGTGNSIIATLTHMLQDVHEYELSTRGSAQIQNIFEIHKTEILELLGVIRQLSDTFGNVYMAIAPPLVSVMNTVVLPVLNDIAKVIAAIAKSSNEAALAIGGLIVASKAFGTSAVFSTLAGVLGIGGGLESKKISEATLGELAKVTAGGGGAGLSTGEEVGAGAGGGAAAKGIVGLFQKAMAGLKQGGGYLGEDAASLEVLGLTSSGAAVGVVGAIATGAAAAIPIIIAGGAGAALLDFVARAAGVSVGKTVTYNANTGKSSTSNTGFQSILPGFLGSAENTIVNKPLQFLGLENSGSALSIEQIGKFAQDSLPHLEQLKQELQGVSEVKVDGVAEGLKAVREQVSEAISTNEKAANSFAYVNDAVNKFYLNSSHSLPALYDDFNTIMNRIAHTTGLSATQGAQEVSKTVTNMVLAVMAGMKNGTISVSDGMTAINQVLTEGLKQGAITWQEKWNDLLNVTASLQTEGLISTKKYMADLGTIAENGMQDITAENKKQLTQQLTDLKTQQEDGVITMGEYNTKSHQLRLQANASSASDMAAWLGNMETNLQQAGALTGKGMQLIATEVNKALGLFGAAKLPVPEALSWAQFQVTGGTGGAQAAPGHRATGGMMVDHPMFIVGEEAPTHPEYVLATNPAYRERNLNLWVQAAKDLGVPGFAEGGTLTYSQLEGLWEAAGGPKNVANVAAAIAEAESGGRDVMQQGQPFQTTGWGYWQITPGGPQYLDPMTNARKAVADYDARGFEPWTTFNDGAYRAFLQGSTPASAFTGGSGATSGGAVPDISSPKVSGAGAIGTLLNAAFNEVTKAANDYMAQHAPAVGSVGAGFAGAPTFPVHKGPVPAKVQDALQFAKWIVGKHLPYLYGGYGMQDITDGAGLDCSGFVSTVMTQAGIPPLGHQVGGSYFPGEPGIAKGPGDWITFATWGAPSGPEGHVMMEIDGTYFESGGADGGPHIDSGWSMAFDHYTHPIGYAQGGKVRAAPSDYAKGMFGGLPPSMVPGYYGPDMGNGRGFTPDPVQVSFATGGRLPDPYPTSGPHKYPDYAGYNPYLPYNAPAQWHTQKQWNAIWAAYNNKKPTTKTTAPKTTTTTAPKVLSSKLQPVSGSITGLDSQATINLLSGIDIANGYLNNLLGNDGQIALLNDDVTYWSGMWGLNSEVSSIMSGGPSAAIQTDANGNQYIDQNAVNMAVADLIQEVGWNKEIYNDYQTALTVAKGVIPLINKAINETKKELHSVGKGSQAPMLRKRLSSLQSILSNVSPMPDAIGGAGATGIGGDLGPAQVTYEQSAIDLYALSPSALQAALATAQAQSGTSDQSELISLLEQQVNTANEALYISQQQYGVLQNLPPYGGSFADGGFVPGPPGAARTVIAHGGEYIGQPGGSEIHIHGLGDFVDRVETVVNGKRSDIFNWVNHDLAKGARARRLLPSNASGGSLRTEHAMRA